MNRCGERGVKGCVLGLGAAKRRVTREARMRRNGSLGMYIFVVRVERVGLGCGWLVSRQDGLGKMKAWDGLAKRMWGLIK
jgi:hypothetical protein